MTRTTTKEEGNALYELSLRKNQALSLFRPLPHQDVIFTSPHSQFLVRGGNRSGKSTCCAVRTAAIATDTPITLSDGKTVVDCRREWQKGKKLDFWLVGYDWNHIGLTMYRLLFRGGLFKTIYDEAECGYRAWRPWEEADMLREKEVRDSPPLIPKRYIVPKSWAWENSRLRQFKKVEIWNPITREVLTDFAVFPSTAEAKAGDPIDGIWIDEKIDNADHYDEWKARLVDRSGVMYWSSWPTIENDALRNLTDLAEQQKDDPEAEVGEVVLPFSDNKAMPEKIRKKRAKSYTSEEERLARDLGQYVTSLSRMYPAYDEYQHQVHRDQEDRLAKAIRDNDNMPPDDWTRELVLDPGTGHPAVLLYAIPPPTFGDYVVIYDEISPTQVDSDQLARLVADKTFGHKYHRMIIDNRAGRQTPMGFGLTVGQKYEASFKRFKVLTENDNSYFIPGSDNVASRIAELQSWLMFDSATGAPKLRILRDKCPELCRQMRNYLKKSIRKEIAEYVPAPRQKIDCAVCLEYIAASQPRYVKPKHKVVSEESWADQFFDYARKMRGTLGKGKGTQVGPKYHVPA